MEVYFIFVTNSSGIEMHQSDVLGALLSYENVNLRFLNAIEFSIGSPMEKFFANHSLNKSNFQVVHLSDILRVMVLHKYGGQYFDLDLLSLVPLATFKHKNSLFPQDETMLSNIFNFDTGNGRKWTTVYLE